MLAIVYLLCSILPVLVMTYSLPNVYLNAVLRCLQFFSGMILPKEMEGIKSTPSGGYILTICIITLIVIIDKFVQAEYCLEQYVPYGFITFLLFIAIIYGAVCVEIYAKERPGFLKLSKLSIFCYSIFMAQVFVFNCSTSDR